MKKTLLFTIAALLLVSCSKYGDVKQFVTDFSVAVSNGDKNTIKKMYPGAANVDKFFMEFNKDSIRVEEDNMTGGYKVLLENGNWFLITGKDKESFKIVGSHGLFNFPKEQIDFAKKTGWMASDMDDQEMLKTFADTTFYDYLFDKTMEQLKQNVVADVDWQRSDIRGFTDIKSTIVAQVTNKGGHEIMGEDYFVAMWSDMEGTRTVKGKNIAPGETIYLSTRFPAEGAARQIYNAALKLNLNGKSKREIVSKYYEVKGGEYNEYLRTK